jgi:hypothetical protein
VIDDPAVFAGGDGWTEIDVPRATAERGAQAVVAALIDSIPAGPRVLTIRRRAAPPGTRRQRVTV